MRKEMTCSPWLVLRREAGLIAHRSDKRREQQLTELTHLPSLLEFSKPTEQENIHHPNQDFYLFMQIFSGLQIWCCAYSLEGEEASLRINSPQVKSSPEGGKPVLMEAKGKYDFSATGDDELSFRKGDILKILNAEEDWCKAEMNGMEGFVPQNYIDVKTPSWFQENATRSTAEELLRYKDVGDFVIRGCQSSPGEFSISVKHENDVQHFKVMRDNKGQYFLWSEKFTSLNKLVDFYKVTSISKTREIYLNDGSNSRSPNSAQGVRGGSLPTPRNVPQPSTRRPSEPPLNQLLKDRNTIGPIGPTGRSSPITHPSRPKSETMPLPQRVSLPQVRALYDFTAEEDDELGFCVGDVIDVLDRSDASWWKGRLRGKTGLFPANYTSQL